MILNEYLSYTIKSWGPSLFLGDTDSGVYMGQRGPCPQNFGRPLYWPHGGQVRNW